MNRLYILKIRYIQSTNPSPLLDLSSALTIIGFYRTQLIKHIIVIFSCSFNFLFYLGL